MSVNDRAVMVFLPSEQHKIIYSQNSHSLNTRSQAHLQNLSQLSDDFAEKHGSLVVNAIIVLSLPQSSTLFILGEELLLTLESW